jgi:hypothetical protein
MRREERMGPLDDVMEVLLFSRLPTNDCLPSLSSDTPRMGATLAPGPGQSTRAKRTRRRRRKRRRRRRMTRSRMTTTGTGACLGVGVSGCLGG